MRVLSRLFRRLFLEGLQAAFDRDKLQLFSELEHLRDPAAFTAYLKPLGEAEWVVYARPPFGGPEQVLAYLGRYTHRVAISNQRLLALQDGQVSFQYKDYRHPSRTKTLALKADEFIRRFLPHALPPHFQRIRNYGFLANANRREKLPLCRRLLTQDLTSLLPVIAPVVLPIAPSEPEPRRCPVCRIGVMVRIETLPPTRCADRVSSLRVVGIDSS